MLAWVWLSTVRPDGRPHGDAADRRVARRRLYFCTRADERKARNLAENPRCIRTTGCNALGDGLDVVIEGDAVVRRDDALLRLVADAYVFKYGSDWRTRARSPSCTRSIPSPASAFASVRSSARPAGAVAVSAGERSANSHALVEKDPRGAMV